MADKIDMTNKGLLLITKSPDYKTYSIDDAFPNSTENKIILEFFIDKPAIPAKFIFELDENKNLIEPGKPLVSSEVALERNLQFSVALTLENAISLKNTIIEAIEEFEKAKNDSKNS